MKRTWLDEHPVPVKHSKITTKMIVPSTTEVTAWQDPNRDAKARKEMKAKVSTRLQKLHYFGPTWREHLPLHARNVEINMYLNASSLQEYLDPFTFEAQYIKARTFQAPVNPRFKDTRTFLMIALGELTLLHAASRYIHMLQNQAIPKPHLASCFSLIKQMVDVVQHDLTNIIDYLKHEPNWPSWSFVLIVRGFAIERSGFKMIQQPTGDWEKALKQVKEDANTLMAFFKTQNPTSMTDEQRALSITCARKLIAKPHRSEIPNTYMLPTPSKPLECFTCGAATAAACDMCQQAAFCSNVECKKDHRFDCYLTS
jgi:hypothetical protein